MQSEFINLGFDKYIYAKDKRSLADDFSSNNRCGIYILHFNNNEYYVGLAIDVVNRHAQHRLIHNDKEFVSFMQVSLEQLPSMEKIIVYQLENFKKPLRNISLVSIIAGDTDLDLIVTKDEQQQWLDYQLGIESLTTSRFDYPALRRKYSKKYNLLKKNAHYGDIVKILKYYIQNAIPFPCKTEYSFWCCSCLPSDGTILGRINIYWQEVLTIFESYLVDENDKVVDKYPEVSLHLCKSKLFEKYSEAELIKNYPSLELDKHFYEKGGQDQINLFIDGYNFLNLINDEPILDAIKEFNLRLMRKGGCIYNRYHCFDLSDVALVIDENDFDKNFNNFLP